MSEAEIDPQSDVSKPKSDLEKFKVTPKGEENLATDPEKLKSGDGTDITAQMIPRDFMLFFYAFSLALGTFQTGWAIFGNTQTAPVFIQKFGWDSQQAKLYTTLVSNSSIVGLFIGSLIGGKIVALGRRKAILIMNAVIIVGTLITLIRTIPTIMIGRFICGCAAGVFNICMSKSICETVPASKSSLFEPMTNISINLAGVICLFLGLALPD